MKSAHPAVSRCPLQAQHHVKSKKEHVSQTLDILEKSQYSTLSFHFLSSPPTCVFFVNILQVKFWFALLNVLIRCQFYPSVIWCCGKIFWLLNHHIFRLSFFPPSEHCSSFLFGVFISINFCSLFSCSLIAFLSYFYLDSKL